VTRVLTPTVMTLGYVLSGTVRKYSYYLGLDSNLRLRQP